MISKPTRYYRQLLSVSSNNYLWKILMNCQILIAIRKFVGCICYLWIPWLIELDLSLLVHIAECDGLILTSKSYWPVRIFPTFDFDFEQREQADYNARARYHYLNNSCHYVITHLPLGCVLNGNKSTSYRDNCRFINRGLKERERALWCLDLLLKMNRTQVKENGSYRSCANW